MVPKAQVFQQPSPDTRIWRYLSFARFVAMLDAGGLFFPRAHLLDDPFEGSFPRGNLEARRELFDSIATEHDLDVERALARQSFYYEWDRQWFMVSCWHVGDHESAAMWSLYAGGEGTVAVQSTFARLRSALPPEVDIGLVQYIDYEKEVLSEGNALFPFFRKRLSFQHEQELRAVFSARDYKVVGREISLNQSPSDNGRVFGCDLSDLIERVYVSPTAPHWIADLIPRVAFRYDLAAEVVRSGLADRPVF